MPDVSSIGFAIMMLIPTRTVLSRLLRPRARDALRDEARISTHPRAVAGGARQVLQRNPLSNEINELTLTKP
jgi:hypothetical protein